jgi:hypothetical protein
VSVRIRRPRTQRWQAACDAAAIVVFVSIGLLAHHRGLSLRGYARDTLPLAGGWFAAAWLFGLYRSPGPLPLLATWALGISAGVLVRALVLGRRLDGSEAAFLGVCLVTIGALDLALRAALRLSRTFPRPGRSAAAVAPTPRLSRNG